MLPSFCPLSISRFQRYPPGSFWLLLLRFDASVDETEVAMGASHGGEIDWHAPG